MQTRILVPLDGSRLAEQALSYAMTLARGLPAELVVFRAISIPSDVQDALDKADLKAGSLLDRLATDAGEYLTAIAHFAQQSGLTASHAVRRGPAADVIVEYAAQTEIQLIVMASHGYTGIKRWRHGSVAERVLQSASVPVLLLRAKEGVSEGLPHPSPCRRILVPVDSSPLAEQVLPVIAPLAQALACEVILFQVPIVYAPGSPMGEWYLPLQSTFEISDRQAHAYLNGLAVRLREQGLEVSTALGEGPVPEAIIDYAVSSGSDLIAMCTHGRTGLARWALGSVADRVLRAGEKPILLVRAKKT
jgi:nucleotide-binding universal stress UspA family protein